MPVLVVIAVGGVLGAEGRYGLSRLLPHSPGQFPWSTLVINLSGCLLIGCLMVVLLELTSPHRLLRPFLGVGVLGGYTTFSTFAVDVDRLIVEHRVPIAVSYLAATVITCLGAVWVSSLAMQALGSRIVAGRMRRRARGREQGGTRDESARPAETAHDHRG